ncbi:TIGR01244 family phosphatase [Palleronia sediminis]|uniref:TIGR01244 family phosphatase n=1 Tax=Palleronia sediminis TaxID=2547833 RepID=A0A4R6AA12_9RHOB|nr:TIGR01244 family sulfur transferase [Palleronia sediminis]TDL79692.1 TIGR01244 family phosphatase [Palleronia sediminis]
MTPLHMTSDYAVSPQIAPEDMAELARMGFVAVINNRPDHEVGPSEQAAAMRAAAEAAGLVYHDIPVENGGLTQAEVDAQGRAVAEADGKVLAWCRSGMRCAMVWALSQAGTRPTDEILEAGARAGFDLRGLRPQIERAAGG